MAGIVADVDWDTAMGRREGRTEMIGEVVAMYEAAVEVGDTARADVLREVWQRLAERSAAARAADCIE
jgi:hypothetical protein